MKRKEKSQVQTRAMKSSARPDASPLPKRYQCPICAQVKTHGLRTIATSGSTRLGGLLKHLKKHHPFNVQFRCPVDGCGHVFRWEEAWFAHYKEEHGRISLQTPRATPEPYAQLVFACGFKDCEKTFEASGPGDVEDERLRYFNHIKNHCRPRGDGYTPGDWSHSRVMRNLMRQKCLKGKVKDLPEDLHWEIQSSAGVQRMLETRDLSEDIASFVSMVLELGSKPSANHHAEKISKWPTVVGSLGNNNSPALRSSYTQDSTGPLAYGPLQQQQSRPTYAPNHGYAMFIGAQEDASTAPKSFHPHDHDLASPADHRQTPPWLGNHNSLAVPNVLTSAVAGSYMPSPQYSPISSSSSALGYPNYAGYTVPAQDQLLDTEAYSMQGVHEWATQRSLPEHQQPQLPVSQHHYPDATERASLDIQYAPG
ncbi:hypothetical protein QBC44DRAFT_329165 [Cladorrhinum sp. PSN332]|nr:hypothetical protein QBC44DRAFT_329165 [Cladorrhinum sp. PSN332]